MHSDGDKHLYVKSWWLLRQLFNIHNSFTLKVLQARLQQYVNQKLPDIQMGFENTEKREIKLPISFGSQRKQGNSRKKISTYALLTTLKSLVVWITTNCAKFLKIWE